VYILTTKTISVDFRTNSTGEFLKLEKNE